jgi:hypothetical protein
LAKTAALFTTPTAPLLRLPDIGVKKTGKVCLAGANPNVAQAARDTSRGRPTSQRISIPTEG